MKLELPKIQDSLDWLKIKFHLQYKASNSKNPNIRKVRRGQVYYCNLGIGVGSEENKDRPCVILQNDTGNLKSPNTIIAPITNGSHNKATSVPITGTYAYTPKEGRISENLSGNILLGNIRTVSKARLGDHICLLKDEIEEMDRKILTSLGLFEKYGSVKNKLDAKNKLIKTLLDEKKKFEKKIKEFEKK